MPAGGGVAAAIFVLVMGGYGIYKLARRVAQDEMARKMNAETEAETQRMVDRAQQIRADDATDSDDWL